MSPSTPEGVALRSGWRAPRLWAGLFIVAALVIEGYFHRVASPLWLIAIGFAVEHGKEYERRRVR